MKSGDSFLGDNSLQIWEQFFRNLAKIFFRAGDSFLQPWRQFRNLAKIFFRPGDSFLQPWKQFTSILVTVSYKSGDNFLGDNFLYISKKLSPNLKKLSPNLKKIVSKSQKSVSKSQKTVSKTVAKPKISKLSPGNSCPVAQKKTTLVYLYVLCFSMETCK